MQDSYALLKLLREMREKDGRDNALIHYVEAAEMFPDVVVERFRPTFHYDADGDQEKSRSTPGEYQADVDHVLAHGWNDQAEPFAQVLNELRPALGKVRSGADVGRARNIGFLGLDQTPAPDFMRLQILGQMLCVRARRRLKYDDEFGAVEDILAALTMGGDLTSAANDVFYQLFGLCIERAALEQCYTLGLRALLGRAGIDRISARLEDFETRMTPIVDTIEAEMAHFCDLVFDWLAQDPKRYEKIEPVIHEPWGEFFTQRKKIEEQLGSMWAEIFEYLRTPVPRRDREAYQRRLGEIRNSVHPFVLTTSPEFAEDRDLRYWETVALVRTVRIGLAVAAYRSERGELPKMLGELVPDYMAELPMDPIGGGAFLLLRPCGMPESKMFFIAPEGKAQA